MSGQLTVDISVESSSLTLTCILRNCTDHVLRLRPIFAETDVIVTLASDDCWSGIPVLQSFRVGPLQPLLLQANELVRYEVSLKEDFSYGKAGLYEVWVDYSSQNPKYFFSEGDTCDDLQAISNRAPVDIPQEIVQNTPYVGMSPRQYRELVSSARRPGMLRTLWQVLRHWARSMRG